jgi:hypothetical protein
VRPSGSTVVCIGNAEQARDVDSLHNKFDTQLKPSDILAIRSDERLARLLNERKSAPTKEHAATIRQLMLSVLHRAQVSDAFQKQAW